MRFTRELDASTRTMLAEIDVPNADQALSAGMFAETTIVLQQQNNVLLVPESAVVKDEGQPYVLTVDGSNKVGKAPVTLGIQGADRIAIVSGLTDNQSVIVSGQTNYQIGEQVQPKPATISLPRAGGQPVMSSFAIKYPFFILMMCLVIIVVGVTTVARMPVDLFPEVNMPVVVVATFYAGMPPQQIESDITNSYERFFTLGSGIDHIESRSLTRRQPDQDFFPARNRRQRGSQQHIQSRHGKSADACHREPCRPWS